MDYNRLYSEAAKRDSDVRDAAYLELTTDICGIAIRPMTPRDFLILDGLDSPLLWNGEPTGKQLAAFLWILSPAWASGRFAAFRFGRKCRKVNFGAALSEIRAYIVDTFQDAPGGSPSAIKGQFDSFIAFMVHRNASIYGWKWRDIIDTPFTVLFQQIKCIKLDENPKAQLRSRRLLKVQGDALRLKTARLNLVKLLAGMALN